MLTPEDFDYINQTVWSAHPQTYITSYMATAVEASDWASSCHACIAMVVEECKFRGTSEAPPTDGYIDNIHQI